ncbi:helix-turn-helix transcriptional regulator [Thorsellia anophelis]|uniref:Predicted DNA-binding transcriptional regulator YafY, contains an HTH and WYL domains n=1 Tax=Thorsellia anophelis DSM 18579 TaxID=1123402 RepID=A0A1I0D1V8_9GAMM|nr:WYL domain-containing protein [Thorsellia anophelis]SET26082.1 Predicted DNA-binding transcriptional regulator YafY, contains an HTH and WYL domains [Thorsellia anophelis DSM 18579]
MPYSERMFAIIFRLMRGDKIKTKLLAEEFQVSQRAIQHDLSDRLPAELHQNLIKEGNTYYLDPLTITSFFPEHIKKILELVDSEAVLPHKLSKKGLQKLLSYTKQNLPFQVQAARRVTLTELMKQNHALLEKAVEQNIKVEFNYKKTQNEKRYEGIEPYKLIDYQGVWYLAAIDNNKIKTFALANILTIYLTKEKFLIKEKYRDMIEQDESIWLSEEKFEVEFKISQEYAEYFTRRTVIPNQKVIVNQDNTILVKVSVTNHNEILPIIRYWMPAIDEIKPLELKNILLEELETFKARLVKDS